MADDPRRAAYEPYLRSLADRMGLKDWSVAISDDPPKSETADASVFIGALLIGLALLREDEAADATPITSPPGGCNTCSCQRPGIDARRCKAAKFATHPPALFSRLRP